MDIILMETLLLFKQLEQEKELVKIGDDGGGVTTSTQTPKQLIVNIKRKISLNLNKEDAIKKSENSQNYSSIAVFLWFAVLWVDLKPL